MNGNAPPPNSRHMNDLINYLNWISKEVEPIKNIPWLGLPEIKSKHHPDPVQGEKLYMQYCIACHREDGQGGHVRKSRRKNDSSFMGVKFI